jgi:FSR family fosmidomycin resistance protein-like MFS transporter
MLTVLPFLGIVLNSTSSVLYVTVPDLATPIAYGMIADHSNRTVGIVAAALTAALTIPLILALRPILENKRSISAEQRQP